MNDKIDLLVTIDKNYIGPLRTMLKSMAVNNPDEKIHIWLLHSAIPETDLQSLEEYCGWQGMSLSTIVVGRRMFENAPVSKRYPQEMYYRLLAPYFLPKTIDKILYLDPDILVINPIRPLWEMELNGKAFAAASHAGVTDIMNGINRIRLGTEHDYYNSGVMLIDLKKAGQIINSDEIFRCVSEHEAELILPDQDIFNYLYGYQTLQVDDAIWNYDARDYSGYLLKSNGEYDMDWVMRNTVFLHFCGKSKPWKSSGSKRFSALYKHYIQLAGRM